MHVPGMKPHQVPRYPVELAPDGGDFTVFQGLRQNVQAEPVMEVVSDHLDQQEQFIAGLVAATVVVKSKSFLEFVDLGFNTAALVVVMEEFFRGQVLDVGHDDVIFVLKERSFQPQLGR